MSKKENERKEIISNIHRNVHKKNWKCIIDNCQKSAINSHLLQQNGILDKVVEGGHLVELREKGIFDSKYIFKDTGIDRAISLHLFCGDHDRDLFREIETKSINFNDYRTQVLFSYRATCAEIRLKERNIELFSRILRSNTLDIENTNPDVADDLSRIVVSSKVGVNDLSFYKEQFESYLVNGGDEKYKFVTIKYHFLKVCASTISSPILPEDKANPSFVYGDKVWNSFFINLIPQYDNLYIIIGYHKDYVNEWILKYIDSWKTEDKIEQQKNITELLATRIAYWGISRSVLATIPLDLREKFTDFWDKNQMELSTELKFGFNLFAHIDTISS